MEGCDNNYFTSYEDIEVHRLMLNDTVRNHAYKKAIMDNAPAIRGKIVLDVGAGTGILSIFCAQAGAAKVYAVEASETYKFAEELVKENGCEGKIEVIHSKIEDFVIPGEEEEELVDVIVSEWMGFYLLHEGMLDSVIYARDNFLKEGGLMFPESVILYAAPCSFPQMYSNWNDVEGISMKSFANHLRRKVSDKPQTETINSNDIIALPEVVAWFDLNDVTIDYLKDISLEHIFVTTKEALYQGVALWFTCTFPSFGSIEPVILSTGPDDPVTHWKQTIIVLPKETLIENEEPIALNIALKRSECNGRRYSIELTMLDPEEIDHPEYCNCHMTKCILTKALIKKYEEENNAMIT